ncbi:MAG: glycosyltransferase [Planctomycetota bacterium]
MRVIHIVPGISEEASGPSYSVTRLCQALIEDGDDVRLATLALGPVPPGLPFVKTFPLGVGPRRLGRSPEMKRWLEDQVLSRNADILHNHGMWQMNAVYPGRLARKGNVPLVVSPRGAFSEWAMKHGSSAKRVFWPMFQRPAVKATALFHATAESECRDIRKLGFRQPVAVIPNGIDVPEFLPKVPREIRTMLFLGRIHPVKGLDTLLRAWAAIQERFPDWRLLIAGSDRGYEGSTGYLDELRALSRTLHLKRFEFVGELNGPAKLQAYRDSDLFVLPTHSENFGITVAEALSAGTPALVTKGAPWADLPRREAGWWVEDGLDPLVAGVETALATPPERLARMGGMGRDWMLAEHGWNSIAGRMRKTYEWLSGSEAPPPEWVRIDEPLR